MALGGFTKRRKALAGSASILPAVRTRTKKIAKLEADRRAGTRRRALAGPSTTQAQLVARQAATKGKPALPLTASQKAAALRKRVQPSAITRLIKAMGGVK